MHKQSGNEIKKPIRVKIEEYRRLFNFEKMRAPMTATRIKLSV